MKQAILIFSILQLTLVQSLTTRSLGKPVRRHVPPPALDSKRPVRFSNEDDSYKPKLVASIMRIGHQVAAQNSQWEDLDRVTPETFARARKIKELLRKGEYILCFEKARLDDEAPSLVAFGRCISENKNVAVVEPTVPRAFSKSLIPSSIITLGGN